ncbi:MAG: hypothetical protein FJW31_14625 [Acidobacteria bacterium]|nr:hypothetical protein [Acidobacteriota bacterium]
MHKAASCILLFGIAAAPCLHARLEIHPSAIDLAGIINTAPAILRGVVVKGRPRIGLPGFGQPGIVQLQVQRWYRGAATASLIDVPFWNGLRERGHECAEFTRGTHWLIFAKPAADGTLALVHDCYGALPISGLLAPTGAQASTERQLEADFAAGLTDPGPRARVVSLHGLGNLRLASSIPALRAHMKTYHGQPEAEWARLAAFRCGDDTAAQPGQLQ